MPALFLICPDCGSRFDQLGKLNRHIAHTKCMNGQLVEMEYTYEVKIKDLSLVSRNSNGGLPLTASD